MPDKTIYESPRIKRLLDDLQQPLNVHGEIIAQFWEEMKAGDVPFFEPYEIPDDEHILVTFLYEGDETTKTVNLGANFMGRMDDDPINWVMHHIPDTNIWYWTEKIARDLRTGYFITPNHPAPENLDSPEKRHAFLKAICLPDPLNKKVFKRPLHSGQLQGENATVLQSIFEAPDAIPETYATQRAGIAKGTLTKHNLTGQFYAYEHVFWVYTPPNYDPQRAEPYPLLFVFDGYLYLEAIQLPTILDNLLSEGKIPPLICVMLNSEPDNRSKELMPNEILHRAIQDDWIPFVQHTYHICTDPAHNIIGGMSLGGLAAAWNAFKNPHIFGNVLSQSGSFWWFPATNNPQLSDPDDREEGWLIRQFAYREKLKMKFYLDVGRYEHDGEGWSHRNLNRHMRDVLIAKGYPVTYQEYVGYHDHIWWQLTIVDGLLALFNDG
ncbi:MAG: alpha/beta hydrolase-fold protein [Aggregatilineales bacterium]